MAHDVFISYSSKDKPIADAICAKIEIAGIRCWIAPRDIAPGEDWPNAVTQAISQSRVMVLVFSAYSNSSEDVSRELFLAANSRLVIIPFKIENIEPEPGKQYYLARTHWLDAINPPTKEQIRELIDCVKANVPVKETPEIVEVQPAPATVVGLPHLKIEVSEPPLSMTETPMGSDSTVETLELPHPKIETTKPALSEPVVPSQPSYLRFLWIPVLIILLVCTLGVAWAAGIAFKQFSFPALPFFTNHPATFTPTNLPSPTISPTFEPTLDYTADLGTSGNILFNGPSENYPESIFAFGKATIIGQAYNCAWFEVALVSSPSDTGWVSADKITYTVKCSDVKAVDFPPTPTPLPSITPIPPTATPRPTTAGGVVAPVVTCSINSNILISNRTGSNATLYLTGPGSFVFNIAPDANTVHVCAGTYNYTITGICNGSPDSGTGKISDGDNIYFSCN
jgi:hypothetical protein